MSVLGLMARAVLRTVARLAGSVVALAMLELPGWESDRGPQRRGLSRVVGDKECPQVLKKLGRSALGLPDFVCLSAGEDALLGEGTFSYGPVQVRTRYTRWRWRIADIDLPEFGESLTLVRWVGRKG